MKLLHPSRPTLSHCRSRSLHVFVVIAVYLLSITAATAQSSVKGKIIDSASSKALGYATITVFEAADTTLVNYRISNPDGEFRVPGLPTGKQLRAVISYSGYAVIRREFQLNSGQDLLDLGTIPMIVDARSLDEVLIVSERPPVVVRNDTLEFNANSFKTLPNALVEDLLRKLPGVQVDRDGNILVNGKAVNRIQVDGKTFFGDDPKMATRNLTANVIDKIQVTDDKEQAQRNGDDNPNNVGKVINITLKKGVKKGWFGKVYAGGGTLERYEAGGIANIYRDTLQVSVLAYMNNLNKTGFSFSELMSAGGFERSRSNSASNSTSMWSNGSGGTGLNINGISFGGLQAGGGISTSKGAGFNLNHAPNKKRSLFLQYFIGNVDLDRQILTDLSLFNQDTIINNVTRLRAGAQTQAHNIGAGGRFKPDSLTNIVVNASYSIGLTDDIRNSLINSVHNLLGPLSMGTIDQGNYSKTYIYKHTASITRLSRVKAGRRISLTQNLESNNRYNDFNTSSVLNFYYPDPYDSAARQLRTEKIPRTDANLQLSYWEPLNKLVTLRANARYELGLLRNNVQSFALGAGQDEKELIGSLSSGLRRTSNRAIGSLNADFKWKDFNLSPGARIIYQNFDTRLASLPNAIRQELTNVVPSLSVRYKTLSLSFNRDITVPFYTYLIPVLDNTNPYFITLGNASLLPSRRNNFGLDYAYNNTQKNLNLNAYISGGNTSNDVVQSYTVDDKGVQTMSPLNADGSRNGYAYVYLYKQYKPSKTFSLSLNTGGNYSYNRSRLLYNGESSWQSQFSFSQWVGANFNFNDKLEYNVNVSLSHNFTGYTNPVFSRLRVNTQWIDNELILRWPKHVIWETQLNFSNSSNVPAGLPSRIYRWNGAVNITFGKSEAAVLKLAVYDILDQNASIWVNPTRNQLTTTQSNVLGQYGLATFTYNIRPGVKKKVGGRERMGIW